MFPFAASVGGFSPLFLPGLAAWYDASDAATVLTSVGPDVPATNGQTVQRWLDKSGNGRHLDQTVLANQPTKETSGVTFGVTSGCALETSLTLDKPFSVFVCWDFLGSGNERVFDFSPNRHMLNSFEGQLVSFNDTVGQSSPSVTRATVPTRRVGAFIFSATNSRGFIGATNLTASMGAAGASTKLVVGNRDIITSSHSGSISEIGFCGADIGDAGLQAVRAYLARKWGVTI